MNNKSKINTSKGKIYFTIAAITSLLLMSFNLNPNMNTSMDAYASIFSDIQNVDDVGQSLECVIVVVGCDGTGSVGSSGDVIIGSGNDDNNTNGGNGETPLPPLRDCEDCLTTELTEEQIIALAADLEITTTGEQRLLDICAVLSAAGTVEALIVILDEAGLSVGDIVDLVECFGINLTLAEVEAILGI